MKSRKIERVQTMLDIDCWMWMACKENGQDQLAERFLRRVERWTRVLRMLQS